MPSWSQNTSFTINLNGKFIFGATNLSPEHRLVYVGAAGCLTLVAAHACWLGLLLMIVVFTEYYSRTYIQTHENSAEMVRNMAREELLALSSIGTYSAKPPLKAGITETGALVETEMRELLSIGLVAPNIRRAITTAVVAGKGKKMSKKSTTKKSASKTSTDSAKRSAAAKNAAAKLEAEAREKRVASAKKAAATRKRNAIAKKETEAKAVAKKAADKKAASAKKKPAAKKKTPAKKAPAKKKPAAKKAPAKKKPAGNQKSAMKTSSRSKDPSKTLKTKSLAEMLAEMKKRK